MIDSLLQYVNSEQTLALLRNNNFMLIFLVILFSSMRHATYRSLFMATLLNLPGTVLHELAHFAVGLFLNAKPMRFSLLPHKSENGYVMGSVAFRNITFYNALPTAMAPLMLLPLGFMVDKYFFDWVKPSVASYLLYVLILIILIENSVPSHKDFQVGFRYLFAALGYLLLATFLLLYLSGAY